MLPERPPRYELTALSAVYLVWGMIASLNDLLIPYLKDEFGLNFGNAMRVQLVFYAAYFFLSIPCGLLARRHGYRNGVLTGLATALMGCLLMVAASRAGSFGVILGALFVIAAGITMLQVSSNPYVTSLGPARTAPSRLTFVQSFHSLGTTLGPWFGALLIFALAAAAATPGNAIARPYLLLAILLAGLLLVFWRIPARARQNVEGRFSVLSALRDNRLLIPGSLGVFCYVGAEIAIASLMVNFLMGALPGLTFATAGKMVSVYWGLALAGRFLGAMLLRHFAPRRMLLVYATAATLLVATAMTTQGWPAATAMLSVGLFNSIMFPTLFALTLDRSSEPEKPAASGFLCLGIVGGAVISQLQGLLADRLGLQQSFVLPVACYVYVIVLAGFILKTPSPQASKSAS